MLTRLDHIVLLTPDFNKAVSAYEIILGKQADIRATRTEYSNAIFQTHNLALEITGQRAITQKVSKPKYELFHNESLRLRADGWCS